VFRIFVLLLEVISEASQLVLRQPAPKWLTAAKESFAPWWYDVLAVATAVFQGVLYEFIATGSSAS
jgi:hypothetical protein